MDKISDEDEAFYAGVLLSIGAGERERFGAEWLSWYGKRSELLMSRCPDDYENRQRFLRQERVKYNIWVARTNGRDREESIPDK